MPLFRVRLWPEDGPISRVETRSRKLWSVYSNNFLLTAVKVLYNCIYRTYVRLTVLRLCFFKLLVFDFIDVPSTLGRIFLSCSLPLLISPSLRWSPCSVGIFPRGSTAVHLRAFEGRCLVVLLYWKADDRLSYVGHRIATTALKLVTFFNQILVNCEDSNTYSESELCWFFGAVVGVTI